MHVRVKPCRGHVPLNMPTLRQQVKAIIDSSLPPLRTLTWDLEPCLTLPAVQHLPVVGVRPGHTLGKIYGIVSETHHICPHIDERICSAPYPLITNAQIIRSSPPSSCLPIDSVYSVSASGLSTALYKTNTLLRI